MGSNRTSHARRVRLRSQINKNALSCSRDPTCVLAFQLKVSALKVVSHSNESSLMRVFDDLARIHSTFVETCLRDDIPRGRLDRTKPLNQIATCLKRHRHEFEEF